ncbi:MAG TPA: hypothetical protein VIE67_04685 [Rudaea sp.]|jgi:hypothetical protein|uniref:hypothetical protein n=1 Tax=Rudaea sp. TaxID=2136325 RepID=UPI002F955058
MKNIKVYYWIPALAAALMMLAGCQKQDPAAVVKQRAVERWSLLAEGHPVKAYEYLSPGYRTTHTLDQYVAFVATARLKWRSARVVKQECEAEVCTVHLIVESTVPATLANTPRDLQLQTPLTEQWIASGGQWYFLPDAAGTASPAAGSAAQNGVNPAGAALAPVPPPAQSASDPAPPPPSDAGK